MQRIQEKTKRMTDLLENWSPTGNVKLQVQLSNNSNFQIQSQGGSETEAIIIGGLREILNNRSIDDLNNLSFREFDYFFRDKNTVPAFEDQHQSVFYKMKSRVCWEYAKCLQQTETQYHKMYRLYLQYNAALLSYSYSKELEAKFIEFIDLEDKVVIIKLRDGLDKSVNWLEEISDYLANLFQDDEINVIPE